MIFLVKVEVTEMVSTRQSNWRIEHCYILTADFPTFVNAEFTTQLHDKSKNRSTANGPAHTSMHKC